jgi:ribosomal protein S18 acetylase RimI-like enzyme
MEIRRAVLADARRIAEVHVRSWKAAFSGLLPQDYLDALKAEDRLGEWQEALGSAERWPVVLVAEEGGRLLGFAAVGPSRDEDADPQVVGELYTIYLDPSAFRSGLGQALHSEAMEALRAGGFDRATLWVLHSNARARRFYELYGWSAEEVTKEHDWEAFTATDVRYSRSLGSAG